MSTKTPLARRNSAQTRQWLIENKFGDEVLEQLAHFSGEDMVALQKTECQELLGTKDGTRLYLRLVRERQDAEMEAKTPVSEGSESPSSPARRPQEPAARQARSPSPQSARSAASPARNPDTASSASASTPPPSTLSSSSSASTPPARVPLVLATSPSTASNSSASVPVSPKNKTSTSTAADEHARMDKEIERLREKEKELIRLKEKEKELDQLKQQQQQRAVSPGPSPSPSPSSSSSSSSNPASTTPTSSTTTAQQDKERLEREKRAALEKQREAEKLAAYEKEKQRLEAEKKKKQAATGGETKQRETFTRWQNMLDSVADDDDDDDGGVGIRSLGNLPAPPTIADEDSEDDEEIRHGDRVVETPEKKAGHHGVAHPLSTNSSIMGTVASMGSVGDSMAESDSDSKESDTRKFVTRQTISHPTPAATATPQTPEQRLQGFKIAELETMSKGSSFTRWDKSKNKKSESIVVFFDMKKADPVKPTSPSPSSSAAYSSANKGGGQSPSSAKAKADAEEERKTGELGYIFWCLAGRRDKSDNFCQPVKKLVEVLAGYHAKTWGLPQPYPDEYRYFSIVGHSPSGQGQLLNLEGEPGVVSAWVNGLHQLLEQSDMALVMTERKDRLIVFQNHPINHAPSFLKGTNLEQKVGFLQKYGGAALGGIGIRRKWQTRFFQRNGDFLEYYEWDDTQRNPFKLAGKICLSGCLLTDISPAVLQQNFVIGVRPANNKRTYYLQADSEEDRSSWKKYFSVGLAQPVHTDETEYNLAGMRAAATAAASQNAETEKLKAAAVSSASDKDDPRAKGNITKQGFLNKLGGKYRKIIWQLRYFQLVGGQLHYFIANKTSGDNYKFVNAGLIPMGAARVAAMGRVQSLGAEHVFSITPSGSRKIYLLEAASETEKEEWINTLVKCAKEFKDKQTTDKNVIKAGYMMKMGGKKANKKYRERYFTLQVDKSDGQGRLQYFKRLGDKIPAGEIVLSEGTAVKTMSIDSVAREHLSEGIKNMIGNAVFEDASGGGSGSGGSSGAGGAVQETVFTIKPMTENRTYVLCCSDQKYREEWVETINKVIKQSSST